MNKELCPHCGQNVSPRRERLNRGILKDLILFRTAVINEMRNEIHLQKDLEFTKSQYNNFQKLRYHALVAKVKEKPGYWLITKRGADFLNNMLQLPDYVLIFNNRIVGKSDRLVTIRDIMADVNIPYWESKETVDYVTPLSFDDNGQGSFI